MAIPHARSGQVIDVRPLGPSFTEERTVALFKTEDLEVIRLVLPAGKALPPHKVAGEITIQCIEGRIDVTVDGEISHLGAGQLVYLARDVVHGVVALEDACALVTIALRR
jgi:quercetin dioxygenase-like cupin family protein